MDAIKKKMQSLKSETENALARAEQLDAEAKESTKRAEKTEEHVSRMMYLSGQEFYTQGCYDRKLLL